MQKILKQGACMCHVERLDEGHCISGVNFMATDFDAYVDIVFDVHTYEITDANWAIHRAPDMDRRGQGKATMIIGDSAFPADGRLSVRIMPDYSKCTDFTMPPGGWFDYPHHKDKLEEVCPDDDKVRAKVEKDDVSPEWKKVRELFLEAVRGAFQAELFLVEERGCKSLAELQERWLEDKNAYCRPYNPPDLELARKWPPFIGLSQHYPLKNTYKKYIQYVQYDEGDGVVRSVSHYNDSTHTMSAEIRYVVETGEILGVENDVQRVPFSICAETEGRNLDWFTGGNVYQLAKRDVGGVIGGPRGCFHMLDVIWYAIESIQGI
ncbi:MAG: DUF2889 domain-containing protein [Firmicutes bacterium]|nr:DUF2889 domain-containing protein [Bacillota bacterium]